MTTAIGRCSTAPAEARATAGVTIAEPCAGTTTPVAPAPSALRADRSEVPRIGDAIEDREQRTLRRSELVRVGVAVRLDEREHALMVARLRAVGELALRLQLRARVGEPLLGLDRALGRP